MQILYIVIGIIILIASYLLITGGWDIGENIQFIVVGFLLGIISSIIANRITGV